MPDIRSPPSAGRDRMGVYAGLAVNPRVHVAFSLSQVLANPVRRQSPFPPFVADGALGDSQDRGYIARDSMRLEPPRVPGLVRLLL
jgi:hypothetical protein